ncbi:PREDICTED: non-specific lipid transfer protein GPI-anchored 1-like isoform X2 [Tarenaya hassleriana]|uniref:non-specific lipid transfer protein GPI-anchored 1-like isoform X1 n=1 Tax=Tarenaya hassleriana TaxID=28532 RepID=UPI00053C3C6C|nr:PREDICTED: non-specific lipid transfer protein GPI-anchored 1-like isoform X1 [Tarenaya hassleriana]XP_010540410.1 PREDICTED: non-specific lipid transfer protein GPI-anchored 1-like isoform X2 [Tarenaya hassleriana]
MKGRHLIFFFLSSLTVLTMPPPSFAADPAAGGGGGGALAEECNEDFQKVMLCLDFARGKVATPTKQCCDSVGGIKDKDPKCLCFIIQQTRTGGEALKQLGVQEDKLLQLPSACQLRNASISDCPRLLGLAPNSPDAAIFSGNATSSSTPAGNSPWSTSTPATSQDKGGSAVATDRLTVVSAVALAAVSFLSAFA